jgi:hypothetical protein
MNTQIDEIAQRIYRFSTFVPDIGPCGFHVQSTSHRR